MSNEELNEILNLDYRLKESKGRIQEALCKIKPLAKYENCASVVPLEKIEKVIGVLCRKYAIVVREIRLSHLEENNENIYYAIVQATDSKMKVEKIYGCCTYELFSKIAIYMYNVTRK